MKIIGHRGAPSLALENTLASFAEAVASGADAIELDVHATKDGRLVVLHDQGLERIGASHKKISEITYDELKRIRLHDGGQVPLLHDVLQTTGNIPVFIELKVKGHEDTVCKILDEFPGRQLYIGSFKHDIIAKMHALRPEIPSVTTTNIKPLSTIRKAKRQGYAGVAMYHIFLPITYGAARRAGLEVMVFPVGTTWIVRKLSRFWPDAWRTAWAARLLERRNWNFWDGRFVQWWYKRCYPDVWVCTDHPERWTGKHR